MDLGRFLVFSTVYYRCLKNEKLWDSIPYHMKDSNEFKHVKFKHLKLENLICVLMQALQNLFTKYWIFVVS